MSGGQINPELLQILHVLCPFQEKTHFGILSIAVQHNFIVHSLAHVV